MRALAFLTIFALAAFVLAAAACGSDAPTEPGVVSLSGARTYLIVGGDTVRYRMHAGAADSSSPAITVARWSVADTTVAFVDGGGLVTSRRIGTTQVCAASDGDSTCAPVIVVGHPELNVEKDLILLRGTATNRLLAAGADRSIALPARWSTADSTIATVTEAQSEPEAAIVTGAGLGHTTVWAHYGPDSVSLTVRIAPKITLDIRADTLLVGQTLRVVATARDANDAEVPNVTLTWTSSNPDVATTSGTGSEATVSARVPGPAVVRAGYEWAVDSTRIAVTVQLQSVATASTQACGLDAAGATWCWISPLTPIMLGTGHDDPSLTQQAPHRLDGVPPLRAVGGGYTIACGLSNDGDVWCWDHAYKSYPIATPTRAGLATAASQLAVGWFHVCALASDGAASCRIMGDNYSNFGQAASGAPHHFSSISAGVYHTCGIDGGTVYCWGAGARLRLGSIPTDTLCGGNLYAVCSATPLAVPGLPPMVAVSAGNEHSCALTADGVAYCWGSNEYGQLGSNEPPGDLPPRPVAGDLHFTQISAGYYHTCGLTSNHEVYCWGQALADVGPSVAPYENCADRLGGQPRRCYRVPARVNGLAAITLSAGGDYTCSIRVDNLPYCWSSGAGQ